MWLLKPLAIRPPFVGSRPAGFFPQSRCTFGFSVPIASRGESTLHLFKEKKLIAFFLHNYRRLYQIFRPLARLILAIPAHYVHCISRDLCVCELVLDEETRWTCACTGYDALSACEPFFSENSGWTRFLLNPVLHYITCAVDDVDAICPNFQDETGTTCCIFTWLPRNLSRFNLRPCI